MLTAWGAARRLADQAAAEPDAVGEAEPEHGEAEWDAGPALEDGGHDGVPGVVVVGEVRCEALVVEEDLPGPARAALMRGSASGLANPRRLAKSRL